MNTKTNNPWSVINVETGVIVAQYKEWKDALEFLQKESIGRIVLRITNDHNWVW